MKYDYIVIGGGVIGMTTSREIAARGATVAVIDRKNVGNEASKVAGGILSSMRPWDENPDSNKLSEESKKNYPDFVCNLEEETGINVELIKSGLIIINKEHSDSTKKWAIDNNIKTTTKRRNTKESNNDFPNSIRKKIFEHDLLKVDDDLIKLAIDKFITDIKNVDYLCKKCLRPVELKKNLRGNKKYNKSFGYNVELSHIEHNPNINNIKFDNDFNIVSKSVEYICSNCHSLEYTQPPNKNN